MSLTRHRLFIDGEWIEPAEASFFPSENPVTGEPWYEAARATAPDVDAAITAAHTAFTRGPWSRTTPTERGQMLSRLADVVASHADELAEIEARDNGKLLREMKAQLRSLPDYFRFYAGLADKVRGDLIQGVARDALNYTLREPLGVVVAITAWNSPLYLAAMKLAPALAMGNTVVLKPSEYTSAASLLLASYFTEAGFPAGVVNAISGHGREIGDLLVDDPRVAKVAFTGSTPVGRRIAGRAGERLAKVSLELGGKSPSIVFPDANFDNVATGVVAGVFAAAGQMCTSGSRLFVHSSVHDEIVARIVERARAITIGDPLESETELGPLVNGAQHAHVTRCIAQGVEEGAVVAFGGTRPDGFDRGWYLEPTVLTGVTNDMSVARTEIFGPVLSVIPFETEEEVLEMANDSEFGLAAGIWTSDLSRAHRMAAALDAGIVWVNTYRNESALSPFGGFKQSGIGKENGIEAILEYSRLKSVWVNYDDGDLADPFSYPG
ncbi:aldehyde dehydrogenase [Microbacterium sp. RD1]|uniref:aldehyde dehydrogenase n=1 Tax=Microbacterium sp. RD1 TaxID=3457313 RepID=UPI003FA55011